MNKTLVTFLTIIFCLTSSIGWSADFQKGFNAYNKDDFATALREWTPLAEQGDVRAQYNLGQMYRRGDGVLQNYKTAVKWYRLSAEQGFVIAQLNLGISYTLGNGVIQDNIYAHMWVNISVSNGHKNAVKVRDFIAKKMTSTDISTAQKLASECVEKKYKGC